MSIRSLVLVISPFVIGIKPTCTYQQGDRFSQTERAIVLRSSHENDLEALDPNILHDTY
jgi:hypothetical protein